MKTGDVARESGDYGADCGHWVIRVAAGKELPPCPQCHQVVVYRRIGGITATSARPAAADGRRIQQEFWGRGDADVRIGRSARRHKMHLEVVGRSAMREGRRFLAFARGQVPHH